ncbi:uncharacterized protein J7T54_007390 [Emericellopsis cladophorae]|uniref:Uncharacterized protein n=1 Tax=Emericellopsis cladophorae TaxID=2686198 RepID=A0A9P9Y058_9HYPO|nr:uncharacterized protein J7T54_007390 [Emericellopsis cladophorae]KAI6780910.1 hypothetical protein J7T54_007390 [Emericellopsis cladophorae]
MGVQLAPYNNAMRLGQGFNSYTQQICLNDAVMKPSKVAKVPKAKKKQLEPAAMLEKKVEADVIPHEDSAESDPEPEPDTDKTLGRPRSNEPAKGVSQIVSYSSRFVDKLSDITGKLNSEPSALRSGELTDGGSFIDSDKFKESDMNFFVQVKVVNQVVSAEDYTEFQDILTASAGGRFNDVYGDTFISGFEEGGELNALISVKVSDKSKTFAIKAELEATLGTPALSGKVTGGVDMNKSEINSSTETTVTVNWSGGGQIKPTNAIWDVNSLTLAAANFPENVSRTPQRTYAILSKYTSLKSFLKLYQPQSVLTYENAGVYTSALLDIYMDYKSIWKQIQIANFEHKNRRADMRIAKVPKEVQALAEAKAAAAAAAAASSTPEQIPEAPKDSSRGIATRVAESDKDAPKSNTVARVPSSSNASDSNKTPEFQVPDLIDFTPYSPTILGLDKARRHCRNEMIKIVTEVDLVTTHPDYALDPSREDRFVSPRIFTQLLPVVTLRAVETDDPDSKLNPKNLVILGETDEAPRLQQWLFNRSGSEKSREPYPKMEQSLDHHKGKSKRFDMGNAWAGVDDPGKAATFFNCLDKIDDSWEPRSIDIWVTDEILTGLRVVYTNGAEAAHGDCEGAAQKTLLIQDGKATSVIQLAVELARPQNSTGRVRGLQLTLDTIKTQEYPPLGRAVTTHATPEITTLEQPTNGLWTFRGFWGSFAPFKGGFLALGVVWGLDDTKTVPPSQASSTTPSQQQQPSGPDYQMVMGRPLPDDALKSAVAYKAKAGAYCMSQFIGDSNIDKDRSVYFNDLHDIKDDKWRISSIKFYQEDSHRITGYIIRYTDGGSIRRGKCAPGTLGAPLESQPQHFTNVTLDTTYLAEQKGQVLTCVVADDRQAEGKFVFQAPGTKPHETAKLSRPDSTWSLAGFWGYHNKDTNAFTQFGIIWAKRSELIVPARS